MALAGRCEANAVGFGDAPEPFLVEAGGTADFRDRSRVSLKERVTDGLVVMTRGIGNAVGADRVGLQGLRPGLRRIVWPACVHYFRGCAEPAEPWSAKFDQREWP